MLRTLLLIACLVAPSAAFAKATGVDSRQEFPPVGCGSAAEGENLGCHVQDANPQLMVTIEGPTQLDVGQGTVQSYTASIPVDFMNLLGSGINVALDETNAPGCTLHGVAPAGKIGPKNDTQDPADFVLSHLGNDTPPSNLLHVWSYDFEVRDCQAPGSVALTVAMNAFDGDGTELGEEWNRTTVNLTAPEAGGAAPAVAAAAVLVALARRRGRA